MYVHRTQRCGVRLKLRVLERKKGRETRGECSVCGIVVVVGVWLPSPEVIVAYSTVQL